MNLIVTECVLLCELCYVCLCVITPQDSMTSIPFTLLDHNRHHITRETTLLSLDRGWSGGTRKKNTADTHTHKWSNPAKNKTKKPPKKHTAAISRGLHNVSLEMVGHSDHFISSPSRDRLHGAQNVLVPPSLLVIISRPVAQSLWNYPSQTLESTSSTFFSLSFFFWKSVNHTNLFTLQDLRNVRVIHCLGSFKFSVFLFNGTGETRVIILLRTVFIVSSHPWPDTCLCG